MLCSQSSRKRLLFASLVVRCGFSDDNMLDQLIKLLPTFEHLVAEFEELSFDLAAIRTTGLLKAWLRQPNATIGFPRARITRP